MPRAPKKCGNINCEERVPGGTPYCPPHTPSWSLSPRRTQLPPDWPQLRQQVKARANGQCEWRTPQRCPQPGTDCDHIVRGNNHHPSNLQWLCHTHHAQKTSQEGNTTRWTT